MNKMQTLLYKILLITILFFITNIGLNAQDKHFIYIQSENKQTYTIQVNEQHLNSTASGYTTISQLVAGKYLLVIGFHTDTIPEQKFIVDVNSGDWGTGYILKKVENGNWVLVNIYDNSIIQGEKNTENANQPDDSIMPFKPVTDTIITPKPLKTVNSQPLIKKSQELNVPAKKMVVRIFENTTMSSIDLIYVDYTAIKPDTIALLIPVKTADTVIQKKINCTQLAGDDDFNRLKLDMSAATTDNFMMNVAGIYFKKKCYSVDQIKILGQLFQTEDGRYHFFLYAHPYLADASNFPSLEDQFKENEWLEKFRVSAKSN